MTVVGDAGDAGARRQSMGTKRSNHLLSSSSPKPVYVCFISPSSCVIFLSNSHPFCGGNGFIISFKFTFSKKATILAALELSKHFPCPACTGKPHRTPWVHRHNISSCMDWVPRLGRNLRKGTFSMLMMMMMQWVACTCSVCPSSTRCFAASMSNTWALVAILKPCIKYYPRKYYPRTLNVKHLRLGCNT